MNATRLKELSQQIPDDAQIFAYDAEDCGIVAELDDHEWFIRAIYDCSDEYLEGFDSAVDGSIP